jgi:uncharacterized membrane protein
MFWTTKFFTTSEEKRIMSAIRDAEKGTSGEVRLYVESHCSKPTHERTLEVFKKLKMHLTKERNAVLIYIAKKDKKFAIFGDEGIHQKVGNSFWKEEAILLKNHLQNDAITEGVCEVVTSIGLKLKDLFPDDTEGGNQLSDKPVYGK